ncbi:MFS transporter [Nonomuraea cavernae]|uniref:MFS transporter n=1 Tax=Nonomuraea cavernae TaxID=2045107 RepID=UPI00340135DC
MSASLPFRLARTSAFAVVCLGLSVVAHTFGGGGVTPPAMAGALALAFAAAYPLSGRERTLRSILPLLGALQAVMHVGFSLAFSVTGDGSPIVAHAPAGSVPGVGMLAHGGLVPEVGMLAHGGLVPGVGMLVAHGWAIGLTALWLARGEALFWAVLRRLAGRLLAVLLPPAPWTPFLSPRTAEPPVLRSAVLRHVVSRRGPPVVVDSL